MRPSADLQALLRNYLTALATGDLALLQSTALPDPELAALLPPAGSRPRLADDTLEQLQMFAEPMYEAMELLTVYWRGSLHLFVAVPTAAGPKLDLRWQIAAGRPRSERDETARAFYACLLTGDREGLEHLAVDTRGLELLTTNRPPSGEHGQLLHVAEAMALVELRPGERYPSPRGVETVDERHAKAGLSVLLGLTPAGLVPLIVKQVEGRWKVSPAQFIMAAAQARGATFGPT